MANSLALLHRPQRAGSGSRASVASRELQRATGSRTSARRQRVSYRPRWAPAHTPWERCSQTASCMPWSAAAIHEPDQLDGWAQVPRQLQALLLFRFSVLSLPHPASPAL